MPSDTFHRSLLVLTAWLALCAATWGCHSREATAYAAPVGTGDVPPGEFEAVETVLFAWDEQLAAFHQALIASVPNGTPVAMLVRPDELKEARRALSKVGRRDVSLIAADIESIWIRDWAPLQRGRGTGRSFVDFFYEGSERDEMESDRLHRTLWPRQEVRWIETPFEGGNLLTNGGGTCVIAVEPGVSTRDSGHTALKAELGCTQVVEVLPLARESTGHVDMFLHFTGPRSVLVGRYGTLVDGENAQRLDRTAKKLASLGFEVRRVAMPTPRNNVFRTYLNALAVNEVVFVSVYPDDTEHEAHALAAFREAYPKRRIVPIDASDVIALEGAIHCAAMTVMK